MAKFCPLFSSSGGNSVYIGSGDGGVLIDAGMSAKQIHIALHNIGVNPETIDAVFVTHEHSDHIKGIRVFASKYHIKVYGTKGTLSYLEENGHLRGEFESEVMSSDGCQAGALFVKPFKTSHDSRESCGYKVMLPDNTGVAVATDLGIMTDEVHCAICGCETVMLESNHDVGMLENGPYPYPLKKRILGEKGHLSNENCAKEVVKLVENGTRRIILGHLSKENNIPQLAFQTSYAALEETGAKADTDYILKVAKPVWDGKAIII